MSALDRLARIAEITQRTGKIHIAKDAAGDWAIYSPAFGAARMIRVWFSESFERTLWAARQYSECGTRPL